MLGVIATVLYDAVRILLVLIVVAAFRCVCFQCTSV